MPLRCDAGGLANDGDQRVARSDSGGVGARLVDAASAVHLASGDTGDAQPRTFGAPNRSVAIPDPCRGACENLTLGDDLSQEHEKEHFRGSLGMVIMEQSLSKAAF